MKNQLICGLVLIAFTSIGLADTTIVEKKPKSRLEKLKDQGSLIEVKSEDETPPSMCGRMCAKTGNTK